jgi:hypothetical protein
MVTRQDADGAVDRFTPYVGGPLALDEFSVGPVMAQTEFSLDAIKPRFPEGQGRRPPSCTRAPASRRRSSRSSRAAASSRSRAIPARPTVGDIRITGGTPKGPRGETLGLKWADADMDYPRCWMGKDRDLHAVICTQPGEPVLRYVFAVPGWTQDTMPPEAVLRDKATCASSSGAAERRSNDPVHDPRHRHLPGRQFRRDPGRRHRPRRPQRAHDPRPPGAHRRPGPRGRRRGRGEVRRPDPHRRHRRSRLVHRPAGGAVLRQGPGHGPVDPLRRGQHAGGPGRLGERRRASSPACSTPGWARSTCRSSTAGRP